METNNNTSKSPFYVGWAMLTVMCVTALLMAYWMFWPVRVLDIEQTTILNRSDPVTELPVVYRGKYLRYRIKYKKFYDIVGEVQRTLVNDRTVTLVVADSSKKRISACQQEIDVYIPRNMWPGKYRLRVDIHYTVNPLRTKREQYETDWFEIR